MKKIERKTYKIDAEGQVLGRLASKIASILRGKHKPEFEPHVDGGDVVEVVNVDKLKLTGKKIEQKKYFSYSGYPGGLKEKKLSEVFNSNPGEVLRRAVKEMISPIKFRNDMMKRLIIR